MQDTIETPLIKFVGMVPGISKIEDCVPKPSKSFIPEWFKNAPQSHYKNSEFHMESKTVKMCPALPDFFSMGYVLPMWADTIIQFDKETDMWKAKSGRDADHFFKWEVHSNKQFIDLVPEGVHALGTKSSMIFKPISPWRLITPPGYSVLQIPMFYHYDRNWSTIPGVIHTDIYHELNQQILYHGNGEEVFIKRGTPLVQYIPFKREKFNLEFSDMNQEEALIFDRNDLYLASKFKGGYQQMQRESDKF
jgi:hypothetical protein